MGNDKGVSHWFRGVGIPEPCRGDAVKDFIRQIREYRRATSFPGTLNPNGVLQQSLGSPWQRRTPGKTIQNPLSPDGVPHRNWQFGFKNRGMWNPVGVQINSNSLTWGAPQSDDPRLCCETRSGCESQDFSTNNPSRRCPCRADCLEFTQRGLRPQPGEERERKFNHGCRGLHRLTHCESSV